MGHVAWNKVIWLTTLQYKFSTICRKLAGYLQQLYKKLVLQLYWACADHFRQHLSNDDCLEDKTEYYRNCSVLLYCVLQLFNHMLTHMSSSTDELGTWVRWFSLCVWCMLMCFDWLIKTKKIMLKKLEKMNCCVKSEKSSVVHENIVVVVSQKVAEMEKYIIYLFVSTRFNCLFWVNINC